MRKKLNKKENKMSLNVLMLESVGMSTHVDDCIDGEWLGSLSSGDSSAMNEWVWKNNKEKK